MLIVLFPLWVLATLYKHRKRVRSSKQKKLKAEQKIKWNLIKSNIQYLTPGVPNAPSAVLVCTSSRRTCENIPSPSHCHHHHWSVEMERLGTIALQLCHFILPPSHFLSYLCFHSSHTPNTHCLLFFKLLPSHFLWLLLAQSNYMFFGFSHPPDSLSYICFAIQSSFILPISPNLLSLQHDFD